MKTLSYFVIAAAFSTVFQSCSSGRMAYNDNDDVYYQGGGTRDRETYSSSQPGRNTNDSRGTDYNTGGYQRDGDADNRRDYNSSGSDEQTVSGQQRSGDRFSYEEGRNSGRESSSYGDGNGNTYITNNYYEEDDYYDYAYSARIRRFYHPMGWSYYDPFYTNLYWYDYNPYSWGVSLYCTYNWWNPRPFGWGPSWGFGAGFGPSWGWGVGWGGGPSWAWGGGWGGGPSWGWGGGSYWAGYNQGFMNGYYAGLYNGSFNPFYFNSLDSYSYYYGPRNGRNNQVASNVPGGRGNRNIGELYGRKLLAEDPKAPREATVSDGIAAIGRPKREIRPMDPELNQPGRDRDGIIGKPRQDAGADVRQEASPVRQGGRVDMDSPGRSETAAPNEINPRSNNSPVRGGSQSGTPSEVPTRQNPTRDTYSPGTRDEINPRNSAPVRNTTPAREDKYTPRGSSEERETPSPRVNQNTSGSEEPGRNGGSFNDERSTPGRNSEKTYERKSRQGMNVSPSGGEQRRSKESSRPGGSGEMRPSTPQRSTPSMSSPSPGMSRPSGSPTPTNRRR